MEENQKATFSKIDIESWERKEYFLHYYNGVRCTYSVTVNVDITEIYNRVKDNGLRLYPTLIWWISNAVNHFEFLCFNHDEDGNIGYYNEVNQSFTFMPQGSEKFHVLWCKYDRSFKEFYNRCVAVMDTCDTSKMFPMSDMPRNCFAISSVPWIEFTSFFIATKVQKYPQVLKHVVKGEKWACSTLKVGKNKPIDYIAKNGIADHQT